MEPRDGSEKREVLVSQCGMVELRCECRATWWQVKPDLSLVIVPRVDLLRRFFDRRCDLEIQMVIDDQLRHPTTEVSATNNQAQFRLKVLERTRLDDGFQLFFRLWPEFLEVIATVPSLKDAAKVGSRLNLLNVERIPQGIDRSCVDPNLFRILGSGLDFDDFEQRIDPV